MLAADKGESKDYSAAITVVELLRFLKPLNATESNYGFRSEMGTTRCGGLEQAVLAQSIKS